MRNPQIIRLLWVALAAEAGLGVFLLLATRSFSSFIVIFTILGFIGGIGYVTRRTGLWSGEFDPGQFATGSETKENNWNNGGNINMSNRTGSGWNFGNFSVNLGTYPERTEVTNQVIELGEETAALSLNNYNGTVRITGQEGLKEIKLTATKRIWPKDEMSARLDMEKLQLRNWKEGATLRIESGDPNQGFVIGRAPRIDLDMLVPASLAATISSGSGEIFLRQYNGDLNARTTIGAITVESYSSGRNIVLNTTSGKITLQGTAAGTIKARSGAGAILLTGVGAERLELESTAGMIRSRGINCGRYYANATTGSVDLYEARVEQSLELRTGAGRIHAETVTAPTFRFDAATGSIFFRGPAPVQPAEVTSGVGSVQLVFQPGAAFNLDARSNVGSVDVNLPVSQAQLQNRNTFQGQVAGGGAPVRVTSQVGSIRVSLG